MYNDHKVKQLHKMLPKTNAYVKRYDVQTKWISFFSKGGDLLKKFNTIWDKVSTDIKKKNLIESLSTIKTFENQNKI